MGVEQPGQGFGFLPGLVLSVRPAARPARVCACAVEFEQARLRLHQLRMMQRNRRHQRPTPGQSPRAAEGFRQKARAVRRPLQRACLGLLLTVWGSSAWAAAGLTARFDREVVPLGETVTLTLTFEDVAPPGTPSLPPLQDLTVTGVSQSTELSIVNGRQTTRQSYNYTLVPTKAGDLTVPSLRVQVGGQVLNTQPLRLRVVPATAPAGGGTAATNLAFLRLVVPKAELFLGEAMPVEIHLYWQNAEDIRMPQLQAEGFSVGASAKPSQTRTQLGNAIYNLAVFRMVVTPARAGALTLGPAECNLTLLIPINNPRRRDLFDPFSFFGPQAQQRPTTLRSDAQPLRVLPLPGERVPEGFSGAVGSYTLSVTAGPTSVGVGDPITVRVQISGRGPLDAVTLPAQAQWRDFKAYPPTAKVDSTDPLGLSGVKTFEQVVIPQNHEITSLPPFRFSFFDPESKAYRSLSNAPIAITVRPTASASAPALTNVNAGQTPPAADDIVHIKARLDTLALARSPLVERPWFVALQGVPLLAWLSLLLARRRRESLANNPRLRRQREVAQKVREGLKDLRAQAEGGAAEPFFATLFRLLQEQLGERLDLPASAITEAVLDERLQGRGLPEATLQTLHELFQTCNLFRYAPQKSRAELASLVPKLEGALRGLQQWKG
jgi:hypothetical protein